MTPRGCEQARLGDDPADGHFRKTSAAAQHPPLARRGRCRPYPELNRTAFFSNRHHRLLQTRAACRTCRPLGRWSSFVAVQSPGRPSCSGGDLNRKLTASETGLTYPPALRVPTRSRGSTTARSRSSPSQDPEADHLVPKCPPKSVLSTAADACSTWRRSDAVDRDDAVARQRSDRPNSCSRDR